MSRPDTKKARSDERAFRSHCREEDVLGRPGSDLLFQVLRLSTIGAGEFYGRVRDGIGYRPPAGTTRPAKNGEASCVLHEHPTMGTPAQSVFRRSLLHAASVEADGH